MKLISLLCVVLILSACAPAVAQSPAPAARPAATAVPPTPETVASPTPSPVPSPAAEVDTAPATLPAATAPITNSETVASIGLEQGIEVYKRSYCGICHTLDVAETRGVFGPEHNHMGTVAAERIAGPGYSGSATTAADYIRESIVDPRAYIVEEYRVSPHSMPAFTNLTTEEVDALVELLLSRQ